MVKRETPAYIRIRRTNQKLSDPLDFKMYPDNERVAFLLLELGWDNKRINMSRADVVRKFYNDPQFLRVYQLWQESGYDTWARPSIDHILPLGRGGSKEADNLQILTRFENMAKYDRTEQEWRAFKAATNSSSDYYIDR